MGTPPNSTLLRSLQFGSLAEYLKLTGWEQAESPNRWLVFKGSKGIAGDLLEIVLPADPRVPDVKRYVASAVDVLSAVENLSTELVVEKVKSYDRDVLKMREPETGDEDSITLKLAATQVFELKNLFGYSACSEQEPKPHFNTLSGIGKKITERYRFCHTFSGSFGFTIASPPIGKPTIYTQATQPSLVPDLVEEKEILLLPFSRRVMERVVRGLLFTQQATNSRDVSILVDHYGSGFNSKMCAAIVSMSKGKMIPLEYRVLWSPKVSPSDDVMDSGAIRLNEVSYQYLEEAEHILSALEPNAVVVQGLVRGLRAKDDPLEAGSARSVAIRWINRPRGERPVDIIVPLNREDYLLASEAHLHWKTVEVTGFAEKVGYIWRLSDPHDFKVLR
jgi:hypothetical protein